MHNTACGILNISNKGLLHPRMLHQFSSAAFFWLCLAQWAASCRKALDVVEACVAVLLAVGNEGQLHLSLDVEMLESKMI